MVQMNTKCFFSVLLIVVTTFCLGCGGSGPANYKVSGTITYKGQPIPEGEVFLRPVGGGPGGFGFIKNGKYETIKGKGSQGGTSKVTFHGFGKSDGETGGGDLFSPYTVEVELPKEDFVYDLEVPSK